MTGCTDANTVATAAARRAPSSAYCGRTDQQRDWDGAHHHSTIPVRRRLHRGSKFVRRVAAGCTPSGSLSTASMDSPPTESELSEWLSLKCSMDGDTCTAPEPPRVASHRAAPVPKALSPVEVKVEGRQAACTGASCSWDALCRVADWLRNFQPDSRAVGTAC